MQQLTPLWLLKYLPNMLACHVTIIHGLKGPSNTITCADASRAIWRSAKRSARSSAARRIWRSAAARSRKVNPMGLMRQGLLRRVTKRRNDTPGDAVRPFDADATGTAVGEGGGLFILEEYEHAKKRGAKIYAELVGFGASQDTYRVTEPDPTRPQLRQGDRQSAEGSEPPARRRRCLHPQRHRHAAHDRAELNGLRKSLGRGTRPHRDGADQRRRSAISAPAAASTPPPRRSRIRRQNPAGAEHEKVIDGKKLNVSPEHREMQVKLPSAASTVWADRTRRWCLRTLLMKGQDYQSDRSREGIRRWLAFDAMILFAARAAISARRSRVACPLSSSRSSARSPAEVFRWVTGQCR